MKKLLFANYIDFDNKKTRTQLIILNILHELRIVKIKQIYHLINLEYEISIETIKTILGKLVAQGLILKLRFGKEMCYYLTKTGQQSIGGVYTLPKVPEHNLTHFLAINDYLIKTLRIVNDHKHLKKVVSERRQVYEAKDFTKNTKGTKYFVADYQVVFETEHLAKEITWSFEIELTMKTKRRYMYGVFPKYIKELKKNKYDRLIYLTPSDTIQAELELMKIYFVEIEKEDRSWIDRLHLLSPKNFETELSRLVETDKGINWEKEIVTNTTLDDEDNYDYSELHKYGIY